MRARPLARRICITAACLTLAACASRLGHRRPGEQAVLPVDLTVSTSEITAGWQRDGDFLVSPPLEEEGAASRVGVLVQLAVEGEFPAFEARATEQGEAMGEWVPLGATFSEGDHHVALADLGAVSTGAQLRIPVDAVDNISSLVWNATIPDEITDGEPAPDDGTTAAVAPLTSDLMGLGIVTRSAWGAVATRCTTRDAHRYRMAVHYTDTGSANPDGQMRSIQHYHMDTRGWCDIGYHFLVGIDGRIFEGRPVELLGAHVSGNNTGNIGVSFIGCFHSTGCSSMGPTTPPDVMLQAGGRLLGTLSRLYSINLDRTSVKGHRDHAGASTDCPGDYLYARIDQLLSIGHDHGLGDTATPPPPDPTPTPTSCGGMTCGPCAAAAGCGFCASQGACLDAGSACTWAGSVGTSECTDTLYPCSTATCWNPTATFTSCGSWAKSDDFSSGRYGVHRYWAHLYPGGVTTITLARTGGTFNPAILVSDRNGRLAYGGDVASLHPSVQVVSANPGRGDTSASVSLSAASDLDVYVYVTDWAVLDRAFSGQVSTSARYTLTATENCGSAMPPPPMSGSDPYAGLTQSGAEVPRAGLTNPTLRATLGMSVEPYGSVVDYGGRSWVSGRVSWFGGPTDTGVGPTETVAISGEVARSLNSPLHPDAATLAAHPERYYYIAMRFSYSPQSTSWWRTARLVIANPRTGVQVVVRPADWGPNTSTGRVMDLSPQTIADLGLATDDTAVIAFARPGSTLGVVH